ncbi:MAG: hypothetical protein FD181_2640 [Prolixibacteraceae bacterium]|nr:MAG: hypothetical protein FD181_2640 [Prolixibacteraceae bacterium]
MTNSELYQFTFQFLVSNETSVFHNNFKEKVILEEEVISKFIRLSSNHLIIPAVYRRLQKTGLSDGLAPELAEHLNEILQLNIKRNDQILQQIDEISFHLHKVGIEPVFMKGTANLLDGLYHNPGDRMIGDIDFLVRDNDFLPASEILLNIGYKTDTEIYDDIKTLKDYPRLFRADVPADIEIHRLPVIPEYSRWFSAELIFKEKKQIQGKINCYVPSGKHKLIQNFIHSQLTNKGHKTKLVSLRDLYDCHLLLKRVNLNEVLTEIKEVKKAKIYFDLMQSLLNSGINLSELDKVSKRFIEQHSWYSNHPRTHYFYFKFHKTKDLITNRFLKAFVDKTVFKNLFTAYPQQAS